MAAYAVHHYLRTCLRMAYGHHRTTTEAEEYQGSGLVERYDESGGGNTGWLTHHQSLLCRREDEQTLQQDQHRLPQRHHACQHPPVDGTPHVGILRYGDDHHRAVVRRHPRTEQPDHHRSYLHLLYGDSLQHHTTAKGFLESWLQYSEGSGIDGTCRQNPEGREHHQRGCSSQTPVELRTPDRV